MNSETHNLDDKREPLIISIDAEESYVKEETKAPLQMIQLQSNAPKNPYLDKTDLNIWYDPTLALPVDKPDYYVGQEITVKSEPNNSDIAIGIPVQDTNYIPKEKEYSPVPVRPRQQAVQRNDINAQDVECLLECCKLTWIWCIWICEILSLFNNR